MHKRLLVVSGISLALLMVASQARPSLVAQAQACTQAPVNVEFRIATGQDYAGWKAGSAFTAKKGQAIDVNCFAKDGKALLSGGTFTVKLPDGTTKKLSTNQVRNYKVEQAGKYTFTCANTSSCSNTDQFTATGDGGGGGGGGTTGSPADINKDGKVTMADFDEFVKAFRRDFKK